MFLLLRFVPGWEQTCVCVYINLGHFSGLSNTNMTKRTRERERESGVCFVFFFLRWDTTGFYFLFDGFVTLFRASHWEWVLGI